MTPCIQRSLRQQRQTSQRLKKGIVIKNTHEKDNERHEGKYELIEPEIFSLINYSNASRIF